MNSSIGSEFARQLLAIQQMDFGENDDFRGILRNEYNKFEASLAHHSWVNGTERQSGERMRRTLWHVIRRVEEREEARESSRRDVARKSCSGRTS